MRRFLPALLLVVPTAHAHFTLVQPPSAIAYDDGGKGDGPCGGGPGSGIVTDAQGGHAIAIRLSEFIFHPGHYRIALSVNSRAELPADPDVVADAFGNSVSAAIQTPAKVPVLADGVFAHTNPPAGDWQMSLVLPNLSCEKCTLQIIEFMAEHGPNPGGGYFYHHCADLRIKADPALPPADAAWPRAPGSVLAADPLIGAIPFGGGMPLVLMLANPTTDPVTATIAIRNDDGNLRGPLIGATVNPNATLRIPGSGDPALGGWAAVSAAAPVLGGYASLADSLIPLQKQLSLTTLTLAFDNTADFATNIEIANLSATAAALTVTAWDEAGNLAETVALTVPGNGHSEVSLTDRMPSTAGKRGIIRVRQQEQGGGAIAGVALRFSATSGVFVALPPL